MTSFLCCFCENEISKSLARKSLLREKISSPSILNIKNLMDNKKARQNLAAVHRGYDEIIIINVNI